MPNTTRRLLALSVIILTFTQHLTAYIYDNRYFRILEVPFSRERYFYDPNCELEASSWGESRYRNNVFVLTANDACGTSGDIGIPEIFGEYNLNAINNALNILDPGRISPLFDSAIIPARGKLQGGGVSFAYDQQITDWFATGISFSYLHLNSSQKFLLPDTAFGRTEDEVRREFNQELGIVSNTWKHTGITDVDFYVRFGNVWNYVLKCRRIAAGLKLGTLFPSGVQQKLNNPASVPFGADGQYGFYVGLDGEVEIKEDLKVGLISRVIKRFAKTKLHRLPIAGENQLFGALIAPARVEPGVTVVFAPYLRLEGIRDGLGVMVNYTLIWHDNDEWSDKRPIFATPQANIGQLFRRSKWAADEVTLNFFYDFSKIGGCNRFLPLISLTWDIPVCALISENVVKTNNIALGLEFRF